MTKKILVVDDMEEIRNMIASLLEEQGYTVRAASGGGECLEVAREFKPDLVLMDVHMPELGGVPTVAAMKGMDETKSIPIILASGMGYPDRPETGRKMGADDFLSKPFNEEELKACIAEYLVDFDSGAVRVIVSSLAAEDEGLSLLANVAGDEPWSVYEAVYRGIPARVLLAGCISAANACTLTETGLADHIIVLAKYRAGWKRVWPHGK